MALVKCPECGKSVSNLAEYCPECGYPINKTKGKALLWFLAVPAVTVAIFIVVAIIGLLAAIAIPNFIRARTTTQKRQCVVNLSQIARAKQVWAEKHNATNGEEVPTAELLDISGADKKRIWFCPKDPTRSFVNSCEINPVGTDPSCKIDPSHRLSSEITRQGAPHRKLNLRK